MCDHTHCSGCETRERRARRDDNTNLCDRRGGCSSFLVFTNFEKHFFSPGSTQPFQTIPHQAHLDLKQGVRFQAIPSHGHKITSNLPALQADGHHSPQLYFFCPSVVFLVIKFLLITSAASWSSFLMGQFTDRGSQTLVPGSFILTGFSCSGNNSSRLVAQQRQI